jgi:hypothetical protein
MSSRAAWEIAMTRSALRAEGIAEPFMPIVSRRVIVSGWRSQIRSSSVTTVATRGARSGATFASPCTTSRPRRSARRGVLSHCARIELKAFHGGPCVTVTGSSTQSISPAQDALLSSGSSSRDTKAVSCSPGSARSSSGISSRA